MPHDFQEKLAAGDVGERILDNHFAKMFAIRPATKKMQRCGIDRIFIAKHNIRFTVEYKTDYRAAETGNAYIEYESVNKGDGVVAHGWLQTSLAQVFVYYVAGEGKAFWIWAMRLKKVFPKWSLEYKSREAENKTYHGKGLIVPLEELESIADRVFINLPKEKLK